MTRLHLVHARNDDPIEIARELASVLRDVLDALNHDDPGDAEDHNAPRLVRAQRHAESALRLLNELK